MKKKIKLFLVLLFAFQLLVVLAMLVYGLAIDSLIEKYGKTYKVKIDDFVYVGNTTCRFELYDYFTYYDLIYHSQLAYICPDENGYYTLKDNKSEHKNAEDFLFCFFTERFPAKTEYKLKTENRDYSINTDGDAYENDATHYDYYTYGYGHFQNKEAYVEIKAFLGTCKIEEVYCDGITIEEYINLIKQGKIKNPYSDIS